MSWFTAAAVQLVLTSMTLGALKNRGVISTDSRKIKNPTLRSCFDGAVDLGADAAAKVERFWESVSK